MRPVVLPASRAHLGPGDEAWCLLVEVAGSRSQSGIRQRVRGAARVRVESVVGGVFNVIVVSANGGRPGERLKYTRAALYATKGVECRAFGEFVRLLWGGQ
jgi:hypothetical protein